MFTLSICAVGCVIGPTAGTTKPLFDPKTDARFDPRLVGTWLPEYFCLDLRKGEGNSYVAGGMGAFIGMHPEEMPAQPVPAYLVQIGKYQYFFPNTKAGEGTSLSNCCRVTVGPRCMIFQGLDISAIIDDLRVHPNALKHVWKPRPEPVSTMEPATTQQSTTQPSPTQPSSVAATAPATRPVVALGAAPTTQPATLPTSRPYNGDLEITDDPAAIRAYLLKHQDDPDFFSTPFVLHRIAP